MAVAADLQGSTPFEVVKLSLDNLKIPISLPRMMPSNSILQTYLILGDIYRGTIAVSERHSRT